MSSDCQDADLESRMSSETKSQIAEVSSLTPESFAPLQTDVANESVPGPSDAGNSYHYTESRLPVSMIPRRRRQSCSHCGCTLRGTVALRERHIRRCATQRRREDGRTQLGLTNIDAYHHDTETASNDDDRDMNIIDHPQVDPHLFASSMGGIVTRIQKSDKDDEVDIEASEETEFGCPQFSESDVVPFLPMDELVENEERMAMREAMLGSPSDSLCPFRLQRSQAKINLLESSDDEDGISPKLNKLIAASTQTDGLINEDDQTIAFLKARLKSLEAQTSSLKKETEDVQEHFDLCTSSLSSSPTPSSARCLICFEGYRTPLVSVACWHVHCKDCWLRVLGVKKLCPQCNAITSPSQLHPWA